MKHVARWRRVIPLWLIWMCTPLTAGAQLAATAADLVIADALVLDGSGAAPARADVVVGGGRILFVGDAGDLAAGMRIDAQGRVLAPGFIDLHSHGDPLGTPDFENFLAMGVTSITLGQDGSSPDVPDLAAWLDDVDTRGTGTNIAMFVGHGTLRAQSGISLDSNPGRQRLDAMLDALDRNLDVAFGLSTGLEYNPGMHAGPVELDALARVVGAHGRLIMSHLRNEDDHAVEASLAELIRQGAHARVHVAHLKSVYGKGEARAEALLEVLERARADGVRITADVYPYTASYTGIALLFPVWANTPEQFEAARRDRYDELAAYLRERVLARNGPEATLLGTEPYTGQTLADLAERLGKPFERVLIDDIGPQGASAAYYIMDDALQSRLLLHPAVAVSSDGHPTGFHPRGHGAFARIVETYVMERGALALPEAVRKMTSLPAEILGLADRGRIEVGLAADLVLFDPARVRATATYERPLSLAEGFDLVVVNGRIARSGGNLMDARAGRVLRPMPQAGPRN
jgi:N-acyl-D-amino-acid deacylase